MRHPFGPSLLLLALTLLPALSEAARARSCGGWPTSCHAYASAEADEVVVSGGGTTCVESARVGLDGRFKFSFLPAGRYLIGFKPKTGLFRDYASAEFCYPGVAVRERATVVSLREDTSAGGLTLSGTKKVPESTVEGRAPSRLRPFQREGKWGYVDASGKEVIGPRFVWAEEFSEGLAAFESDEGKHGYIDETGRVVIEPRFDNWTDFSEGLAAVSVDFAWGYIDKTGAWAIPPRFSVGMPFSDGMALVSIPVSGMPTFPPGDDNRVFIDKTGSVRIDPEENILNGEFSEGFAAVQLMTAKRPNQLIIDKTGKVIRDADEVNTSGFRQGLAPVRKQRKWGYVDAAGAFVIEPQFDEAHPFSEGLAAVLVGKKWGYIDRTGRLVIKPKYDLNYDDGRNDFSEGLALVGLEDRCTYIDKRGQTVFRLRCSESGRFVGGLASVHLGLEPDEKRGYVNRQGRFVWGPFPFKYQSPEESAARAEKDVKDKEVLTPLTEEERALDPRRIVAGQPDFVADLTFFYAEGFGGFGGSQRIARKGKKYREESQFWLFIGEEGKFAARVSPATKTYDDLEQVGDGRAGGAHPFNPRTLAEEPDVTFNSLGTVMLGGHKCLKIEAVRKGRPEKIYLYAARDLKDLIVVGQVLNSPNSFVQRLGNVSLEVPDSLVEIPPDYKPIERDRWTKVETARVTYKGRPSKDFGVFRAPGGELFVWVNDAPYPWHYLVRPSLGKVETAFRGLLVTRAGKYVWQTDEREAFSPTHYRTPRPKVNEWDEDNPVSVGKNSVKFRSNNYDTDRALIEVRW